MCRGRGGTLIRDFRFSWLGRTYGIRSRKTSQMSVLMFFCDPHLPLAFQFACGPGGERVSLCLVTTPQAAAGYSTTKRFCWRTTCRNNYQQYGNPEPKGHHLRLFRGDGVEAPREFSPPREYGCPFPPRVGRHHRATPSEIEISFFSLRFLASPVPN